MRRSKWSTLRTFLTFLVLLGSMAALQSAPESLLDLQEKEKVEGQQEFIRAEDMGPGECRFKNGYYIRDIGPPIGTIRYQITHATFIAHREVNRFYVKNRLEWVGPCTYRLITIQVTDPILKPGDWPGKKADYQILGRKGRVYLIKVLKTGNVVAYVYMKDEIPWEGE